MTKKQRGEQESELQKTRLLARLMQWEEVCDQEQAEYIFYTPEGMSFRSLYDPNDMQIAWQVLNWAYNNAAKLNPIVGFESKEVREQWYKFHLLLLSLPPAEAQAAWLDMVLAFARKSGLVEE